MDPHKNMKKVTQQVSPYDLEGTPEEISDYLTEISEGLIDVQLTWDHDYYYELDGWRPMTEKELADAKRKREAERIANKAKQEKKDAAERAEYERLKKKFESEDPGKIETVPLMQKPAKEV